MKKQWEIKLKKTENKFKKKKRKHIGSGRRNIKALSIAKKNKINAKLKQIQGYESNNRIVY